MHVSLHRALPFLAALIACVPGAGFAQLRPGSIPRLPEVRANHEVALIARTREQVTRALLTEDPDRRRAHAETAEALARALVEQSPESADAHYWLGVVLGIRTEWSGPLDKISLGQEVLAVTRRVLELDPSHAGGPELMGRIQADLMGLPWVVRKIALGMGMGEAVGEVSWEIAASWFERAIELDRGAIAPALELARVHLRLGRTELARDGLEGILALPPRDELDEEMLLLAADLMADLEEARGHEPEGRGSLASTLRARAL